MRKIEKDYLANIEKLDINNNLLAQIPKTPQQHFLLTLAALFFLKQGIKITALDHVLKPTNSSFSQLLLSLRYMKKCMDDKINLQDPSFRILNMLVAWMDKIGKLKQNKSAKLVVSTLLPHPHKLGVYFFQELIVYYGYIASDLQNILKSSNELSVDDLLQFLFILLPRVYYNIILPKQVLGQDGISNQDVLFYNESVQYFIRTRVQYRNIIKIVLKAVIGLEMKPNQIRNLVQIACRYYLLFWYDKKLLAEEIFLAIFAKASEAVKFSFADELVLFFKVAEKLGANRIQKIVRQKWQWVQNLMNQFGEGSIVGNQKDEVNPFNSLGIRQSITIDSGKSVQQIIEIYHDYSLFYFLITVQNHDINLRLYYLGDFDSQIEVKKLLHSEEHSTGQIKSAFMATKRGIYLIQLDNSYSWINSKSIKLEYVILGPHSRPQDPQWMQLLFETNRKPGNAKFSQMKNKEQLKQPASSLIQVTNQAKQQNEKHTSNQIQQSYSQLQIEKQIKTESNKQFSQPKQPDNIDSQISQSPIQISQSPIQIQQKTISQQVQPNAEWGQANLSVIDNIFSLVVSVGHHTYELQTNLEDRILKKLKTYAFGQAKLQWIVNGQARGWLKKHSYSIVVKSGITSLALEQHKNSLQKQQSNIKNEADS